MKNISLLARLRSGGNVKKRKRVGRGRASGHGKTCGRGTKGENSRTGGPKPPWFEGGQMPLLRRLPKRGFTNIFKKEFRVVNLRELNRFEDDEDVTPEKMLEKGIVHNLREKIKILGHGSLEKRLNVKAHSFSRNAEEKIMEKGGKTELIKG